MLTAKKIVKPQGQEPDDFEQTISQVHCVNVFFSQASHSELAACFINISSTSFHVRSVLKFEFLLQALLELEMNSTDLKSQLRELYICGAKVSNVVFWTVKTLQSFTLY